MSDKIPATTISSHDRLESLRITEIFYSLQGEARSVGRPTVFVRLTGCPLRCHYCDTTYSFHGGQRLSLEDIVAQVDATGADYVCVTGGEPLAQPACLPLLQQLCDRGYQVSLETSGSLDIASVDERVSVVLDLKTPGSGESKRNLWSNIAFLRQHHQVKFVLCDRLDYDWAKQQLEQHQLQQKVADVLFSPVWEQLPPADLAGWILADKLPVRFQLQLHKMLWGDSKGR